MQRPSFSALADTIGAWWTGLFWTSHRSPTIPPSAPDQGAPPPHVPDRRRVPRQSTPSGPADAVRSWFRTRAP